MFKSTLVGLFIGVAAVAISSSDGASVVKRGVFPGLKLGPTKNATALTQGYVNATIWQFEERAPCYPEYVATLYRATSKEFRYFPATVIVKVRLGPNFDNYAHWKIRIASKKPRLMKFQLKHTKDDKIVFFW